LPGTGLETNGAAAALTGALPRALGSDASN
jgi:hypothetical protein